MILSEKPLNTEQLIIIRFKDKSINQVLTRDNDFMVKPLLGHRAGRFRLTVSSRKSRRLERSFVIMVFLVVRDR